MLASILARKIYHMCAGYNGGIDYLKEMDELEDERIDALKQSKDTLDKLKSLTDKILDGKGKNGSNGSSENDGLNGNDKDG